MGVYYTAVCDEKRELIEPGDINDLGIKRYAIGCPTHPFGAILVHALVSRWSGCKARIVGDFCDEGEASYADVTAEVLKSYVETYKEHACLAVEGTKAIEYTGDDRS